MLVVTKMDMVQWNLELRGTWVTKWIEGSFAEMRHTREQVWLGKMRV